MKTTTLARALLIVMSVMILAAAISGQNTQKAALHDPVAELAGRIARAETHLDYESNGWGYLPSLLKHLDLNIDQRLYDVLSGKDQNARFAHLSKMEREAILEILTDTKADLPDYWIGNTLVGSNR